MNHFQFNMRPIPYGRHYITSEDIDAVVSSLQSDYLTQGPAIKAFEEAFAAYVGSRYAVAVSNGTAALHLSTLVLGVGEGQRVITTPITFAASGNCILYCGGEVEFADIDPHTYLLDLGRVEGLLRKSRKRTYAGIIPVDFAGNAVNLEAFRKLADEYGLWMIEDACHAPGGFFKDAKGQKQSCGNGAFADLAIFSFHPVKHIACGEGGMITTNNEKLYNRLLTLRSHGITREQSAFVNSRSFARACDKTQDGYPGWYMEMQELGFNYRLTDFQAALGLSQLKRAKLGLLRRREIADYYFNAFEHESFVGGQSGVIEGHAYHLYVLEVEKRLDLYEFLRASGVHPQIHYIPLHLMPYYRSLGWKEGDFPHAEAYYKKCLSLPMFPTLTMDEQELVTRLIKKFYHG